MNSGLSGHVGNIWNMMCRSNEDARSDRPSKQEEKQQNTKEKTK